MQMIAGAIIILAAAVLFVGAAINPSNSQTFEGAGIIVGVLGVLVVAGGIRNPKG
jgi:hypothetical protein